MKTWPKRHSETKGLCAQLAQTHGGQLRGLRNSLLLRPPTDMRLGPSANCGYLDMLGLRKSHPGQMPKPKRLDPAGLSRSQVHTDGKGLCRGRRDVEVGAGAIVNIQKTTTKRLEGNISES